MQSEGPTHYWLFKNVMRFMAWAPCSALGVDQPWAQPEGWDLLALIDTAQDLSSYNIKQSSMPFAAVLRRASSAQTRASCRAFLQAHPAKAASRAARTQQRSRNMCAGDELVVLVRGTTTAYDWFYNLDFDMSTNAEYGPGGIHTGFLRLADSIWDGGLRNTLDQFSSSLGSVTIAGHSLGAATAALLAARAQVSNSKAPPEASRVTRARTLMDRWSRAISIHTRGMQSLMSVLCWQPLSLHCFLSQGFIGHSAGCELCSALLGSCLQHH